MYFNICIRKLFKDAGSGLKCVFNWSNLFNCFSFNQKDSLCFVHVREIHLAFNDILWTFSNEEKTRHTQISLKPSSKNGCISLASPGKTHSEYTKTYLKPHSLLRAYFSLQVTFQSEVSTSLLYLAHTEMHFLSLSTLFCSLESQGAD